MEIKIISIILTPAFCIQFQLNTQMKHTKIYVVVLINPLEQV